MGYGYGNRCGRRNSGRRYSGGYNNYNSGGRNCGPYGDPGRQGSTGSHSSTCPCCHGAPNHGFNQGYAAPPERIQHNCQQVWGPGRYSVCFRPQHGGRYCGVVHKHDQGTNGRPGAPLYESGAWPSRDAACREVDRMLCDRVGRRGSGQGEGVGYWGVAR